MLDDRIARSGSQTSFHRRFLMLCWSSSSGDDQVCVLAGNRCQYSLGCFKHRAQRERGAVGVITAFGGARGLQSLKLPGPPRGHRDLNMTRTPSPMLKSPNLEKDFAYPSQPATPTRSKGKGRAGSREGARSRVCMSNCSSKRQRPRVEQSRSELVTLHFPILRAIESQVRQVKAQKRRAP